MAAGDTLLNALIGAVVSVVLSFLPFATVLGGGIAGYLQDGDYATGAKVGALSGLIAFLPFVGLAALVGAFLPFVPIEVAGLGLLAILVIGVIGLGYFVGAGALGGVLGVYLRNEL
ncbi:DUF5518 domain-containing protein [Natronomonas sp. EA1]|uniref:DUF5518 domain-containing protein n=1 Tax=Natronomonas sp. EA1 TaxID=3421655 RepID=UPI003EBCA3FA